LLVVGTNATLTHVTNQDTSSNSRQQPLTPQYRRLPAPIQFQSESAECAIASLAMVLNYHGSPVRIADMRARFGGQPRGTSLKMLIAYAQQLGLQARAVRLDLPDLCKLSLPCILHWGLNHFVVLERVHGRRAITIADPAVGRRKLRLDEVSRQFTGVALELTPGTDFQPQAAAPRLRLRQLTGRVTGLWRSLAAIGAVALALEFFAIVAPLLNQLVVDDAIVSHDQELLAVLALGFGVLLIIQTVLGLARSWMVMVLGQTLSLQWLGNVFAHLVRLPVHWFERRHLGDITSRFGAVGAIQRTVTTALIEAVLDGIMVIAALVMMLLYAPSLTAVVLVAVVAYGLLRWASYRPLRDAAAERLVVAARENTHFLESLRAIQPLKLFGREEERRGRWQNLIVDVQNRDVRTAKLNIGFATANTFIFGVENLLVFWLGAKLVMDSQSGSADPFSIGMLFAFVAYKSQFTGRVSALINYAVEIKMLGLHAERLADIALAVPETDTAQGSLPEHDLAHLSPSLELRHVSFRYGEGEPWVLRHASLTMPAGQSLAIVGPSGAGKTTMLKLDAGHAGSRARARCSTAACQ
jgi:ATP-binding cassette subfamily B protein RaxB